jgi:hypothetical protein
MTTSFNLTMMGSQAHTTSLAWPHHFTIMGAQAHATCLTWHHHFTVMGD